MLQISNIKIKTKTSISVTIAASLMLAISTMALFLGWGMMATVGSFKMALGDENYIPFININEAMSQNSSVLKDGYEEFSDWMELHNNSDVAVDLQGYYLSDGSNLWIFPEHLKAIVPPEGYVIVFLSGKNSRSDELHASFSIKAGETLQLISPDEQIIDTLPILQVREDISLGRKIGDFRNVYYFYQATPGAQNSSQEYESYLQEPSFSIVGGFYKSTDDLNLELNSNDKEATIYYTLDGTEPTQESYQYLSPIAIQDQPKFDEQVPEVSRAVVVSAKVMNPSFIPSRTVTHTYLRDVNSNGLAVISLVTTLPNESFDVLGNIEFFEPDGSVGFNQRVGVQLYGNSASLRPQKSFSIFARSKYGSGKINYQIFPDKNISEFESFVLRNSSGDWGWTMFRDGFQQSLVKGMDIDTQAYRPARIYLNGAYYGILNVREKLNEHYVAQNHGVDWRNIDLLEVAQGRLEIMVGGYDNYDYLVRTSDTKKIIYDGYAQKIYDFIDIDNLIDYVGAEIYFNNYDWPKNNMKFWRERSDHGKWRWILYDLDAGFDPEIGLDARDESNNFSLWNNLLLNCSFTRRYIDTLSKYLDNNFSEEKVISIIDSFERMLEDEIVYHVERWDYPENWRQEVEKLRIFARERPEKIRQYFDSITLRCFQPQFFRGDANTDGMVNITDPITILRYLFLGDPISLVCEDAADVDDSGFVDITDAIYLLKYLYTGESLEPSEPFNMCGGDPTKDNIGCYNYTSCVE